MNFRTLSNLGVDAPECLNRHLSFVFLQRKPPSLQPSGKGLQLKTKPKHIGEIFSPETVGSSHPRDTHLR